MTKLGEFRRTGSEATIVFLASLTVAGCGGLEPQFEHPDETLVTRSSALTAITISGVVTDTSGITVDGVQVTLTGSTQATAVTDFDGEYHFTVNPGSYTVSASGVCGTFAPNHVNVNNLIASTTVDFVGSGGSCSFLTSSGGTAGALTLSGVVTSAGHAVVGARVTLNGSSQGFRITDEAGAYRFSIRPGSYSLGVSGGCSSFTPSVVNLNNLTRNTTQNFAGSGNCPAAPLALCPALDLLFLGGNEPASCNLISTPECAFDRSTSWDAPIVIDFAGLLLADCRFGQWFDGPAALTDTDTVNYINDLFRFTLYLLGCPATGTQVGPLSFQLIPSAFQSRTFTTADTQALATIFSAAIAQAVSENGSPALTAAQTSSIAAQLASLAGRVPGVVTSSTLSASTCP